MKTMSLKNNTRSTRALFLNAARAESKRDWRGPDWWELHESGMAKILPSRFSTAKGRTILVPVDLTDSSRTVLKYALRLAEDQSASIVLLHAVDRTYGEAFLDTPARRSFRSEMHRVAGEKLNALMKPRSERSVPVRRVVRHGAPEYEILRMAKKTSADLIVLGRRRRNSLSRLVLGSVTHDVIDAAPCPIVVVPIPGNR